MKYVILLAFLTLGLVSTSVVFAKTVEIQMLNKDPKNKKVRNVFRPAIVRVNSGDTVRFVAVDKGHNSQSLAGMIPEGAEEWSSKVGQDFDVIFNIPGVYGYRCTPHVSLGMVGLIVVEGDAEAISWDANLEAVKGVKQRGKPKKKFDALWPELEAIMANETNASDPAEQ